jgi:hypothetical protein
MSSQQSVTKHVEAIRKNIAPKIKTNTYRTEIDPGPSV